MANAPLCSCGHDWFEHDRPHIEARWTSCGDCGCHDYRPMVATDTALAADRVLARRRALAA